MDYLSIDTISWQQIKYMYADHVVHGDKIVQQEYRHRTG